MKLSETTSVTPTVLEKFIQQKLPRKADHAKKVANGNVPYNGSNTAEYSVLVGRNQNGSRFIQAKLQDGPNYGSVAVHPDAQLVKVWLSSPSMHEKEGREIDFLFGSIEEVPESFPLGAPEIIHDGEELPVGNFYPAAIKVLKSIVQRGLKN